MIKRILLINPNFFLREKFDFSLTYPLGLAIIAAVFEKNGFFVSIIDANALNMLEEKIIEEVLRFKPDIIGISCNFSPLHNPTLSIASALKKSLDVPIAVGGNHVGALKDIFIQDRNIDYIVGGEAEYAFLDLVCALNHKSDLRNVPGISFKEGGRIVDTKKAPLIEDLDGLPLPAYHLLPMHLYERYSVMTSRGCPFRCSYCASDVIFGKTVRRRSIENVIYEIEYLLSTYGKKVVWFCDDTFTADEEYVVQFCERIKEKKLSFPWRCHTHVSRISEEMLREMKSSGCFCIVFGVESGSKKILKEMHKAMTRKQVIEAIQKTKEFGIDAAAFFMVGMPGEDVETILESYRLIEEARPTSVSFCITLPLPGTELFINLLAQHKIRLNDLKWDYFFARIPGHREEEYYAASLASRWCGLKPEILIQACITGDKIPSAKEKLNESEFREALSDV